MYGLAGLLQFARYLRGAFVRNDILAYYCLLLSQTYGRVIKSQASHIFQLTITTTPIIIQVVWREEPSVDDTYSWYASCLNQVHKVPIAQIEVLRRLVGCHHTIEML